MALSHGSAPRTCLQAGDNWGANLTVPPGSLQRQPCGQIRAAHWRQCIPLRNVNLSSARASPHQSAEARCSPVFSIGSFLARRRAPLFAHIERSTKFSVLKEQYSTQSKKGRTGNLVCCNAALSVALPSPTDVDTWRLIIERVTVFFAIIIAHFAGSSQPSWRFGLSSGSSFSPNRDPYREPQLESVDSSVKYASTADWGAEWGDQWGDATSDEQIADRRSSNESATTSDRAPAFPPRIWGDISDKLRAPPLARRGALTETVLTTSPELSVQGLAREPRRRLLASALGALRESVESLPEETEELGVPEWRGVCEDVLMAAVRGAKSAWLEETDVELGSRKRVRSNLSLAEKVIEQSEVPSSETKQTPVESSWMQSLLRRKPGLGETQMGLAPNNSEEETSPERTERQNDRSDARTSDREPGSRAEWGGWNAPVFRVGEKTDSNSDGELPKELALMAEKLRLYEELLFYLRFKECR